MVGRANGFAANELPSSLPKSPPLEMKIVSCRSPRPVSDRLPGTSPTHCSSAPLVSPKVRVPQAPETNTLPARWPTAPPWPAMALSARMVAPKVMPLSVSPVMLTPKRTRETARRSSSPFTEPSLLML